MPYHLQEHQSSESIEQELNGLFLLEDTINNSAVWGQNPKKLFSDLSEIENFIEQNPEIKELTDCGFAGYISFEGKIEFGFYENLENRVHNYSSIKNQSFKSEIISPSKTKYIEAIYKCKHYIKEGDIYQANIAHKFVVKNLDLFDSSFEIYKKLCSTNPSPSAAYYNSDDYIIVSSSPETFFEIKKYHQISSKPIKGTCSINELDLLMSSSKEQAEHIMIVDLIRNDFGKICQNNSIHVDNLLTIEKFTNLYHLVSTVKGYLNKYNLSQIFAALAPGGSISGTPKKRAIEIIQELEACPRGPYTGALGYFKLNGDAKFNILIRTLVFDKKQKEISFHTGAGITAYSDPEQEYLETLLKAEKLISVFK
ncbi:MAG: anthranilate synthase component I family protein [Candidatus Caenarcaniphilales bacterium]|jgi:anthranilate/para-aminobenzoate synthase component I|nr:anthranilate synthase component I family protein [Candidatus Caenarcaniphilales bacterium]